MRSKADLVTEIQNLKVMLKERDDHLKILRKWGGDITFEQTFLKDKNDNLAEETRVAQEALKATQEAYRKISMLHSESMLRVHELQGQLEAWTMRSTWYGRCIEWARRKILRKKWHE